MEPQGSGLQDVSVRSGVRFRVSRAFVSPLSHALEYITQNINIEYRICSACCLLGPSWTMLGLMKKISCVFFVLAPLSPNRLRRTDTAQ